MNYKLTDTELQIGLAAWPARRVRYTDILEVRAIDTDWKTVARAAENWTNPWPWKYILIRQRASVPARESLTINPKNRDEFIAGLRQKMAGGRR